MAAFGSLFDYPGMDGGKRAKLEETVEELLKRVSSQAVETYSIRVSYEGCGE